MDLAQAFDDRLQEINAYLTLLEALERQVQDGPPRIGGESITGQHQRILYSAVYLQLYNLVEATATGCIRAVAEAAADNGRWQPGDLSVELRREWVRYTARTHVELNADNRLATTMAFCDRLIQALAISDWEIEKGAGGNWDDLALEHITTRIGLQLHVSADAYSGIKRPVREDKGPLSLVKFLRNQLAHGDLSFSDCGDGVTVADLVLIKDRAEAYLREVVHKFMEFINGYSFLLPERRPVVEDQA